ncbi:MAG: hypothetical protein ACWA5R_08985 [bacterium]
MKHLLFFLFVVSLPLCASQSTPTVVNSSSSLIVYEAQTEFKSSAGGSGSSRTRNAIIERTIGKKDGGLELEYSFPQADIPENNAWKLPARVLIMPGKSIELLNESEIESRLENYLQKHPEIRKQCGGVVFTWTAFEIHCNTNHVVDVIESYNLYLGPLSEGKLYEEPGTLAPVPLREISTGGSNLLLEVKLVLDPERLQLEYEKSIEQVAAITGDSASSIMNSSLKLTGEEKPEFSGNRVVTIEVASNGQVVKIQREITTTIKGGGTFQETRIQKETLERQPIE